MEAEGILTALAEIAIAIAGFSGIVVALDRSGQPWSELDRARLSMLLQVSLSCVFWSLLPIALHLANLPPTSVWLWSSGLWLAYMCAVLAHRLRRISRVAIPDEDPSVRWVLAFMFVTVGIALVVQLANVVWLAQPWPHVLALLEGLLISCVFFVRLLRRIVQPSA
jgi:hypothetical protein